MNEHDRANILMVDDQPGKLLSYEAILSDLGENLIKAKSAREALDQLLRHDIAVVLMYVSMPEIDGFELADMMHQHPRFQKTAIIFISAVHLTDLDRIKGYQSGAVDYISVPVVPELLRAKVGVFAELHRKNRQLERLNHELEQRVEERTQQIRSLNSQLEQRLAELETIMQVLPVGVAVSHDPECRNITANAALSSILKLPPGENISIGSEAGSVFLSSIYQEGQPVPASMLPLQQAIHHAKAIGPMEIELRHPDGISHLLLASASPLFDSGGHVRGAVAAIFDLTSRKQLEDLLRQRAELLELASEAVIVRDLDGIIRYWNAGAESVYGWSREQALGCHLHQLLQTVFPCPQQEVENAVLHERSWRGRLVQRTRTGTEIVVASRKALDPESRSVLEINRDITGELRAEDALRKTERLAAMGRVAGIIAHEINNPLESISNTFYLLRSHPSLDDEARHYAQLGEDELHRLSHITRQTLGFYRESKDPVEVSVSRLLDDILELQSRRLEFGKIAIRRQYRSSRSIHGFPVELKQVFLNLIGNAVQAMPAGGTLRLRVIECRSGAEGSEGLCVSITDTGTGIESEHAHHLFEPFFTTKSTKGTGLGLWISKGIVQKYGGSIRFRSLRSSSGISTCFQVFLPEALRDPSTAPPASTRSSFASVTGGFNAAD